MNTSKKALALCHAIEAAGASEQLTHCSILASGLMNEIATLEEADAVLKARINQPLCITETDVIEFLSAKAKELNRLTNNSYASVGISITETLYNGNPGQSIRCNAYVDGCKSHRDTNSLDVAIGLIVAEMAPAARVEALRAQAAKLLAEADSLSPVQS